MDRVVYLHVGAPKTGTTYLQDRLALNRNELARHGVHYPLGLRASQFRPALDLLDMPWGGQREDVEGEWDALMGRVRRHRGSAIVSDEILPGARFPRAPGGSQADADHAGDAGPAQQRGAPQILRALPGPTDSCGMAGW